MRAVGIGVPGGDGVIERNVLRIINETQIITHASEEGRQDVIERSLSRIDKLTEEMRSSVTRKTPS